MVSRNVAAQAAAEETARAARHVARQKQQSEAERRRVEVHALNQLLAMSDAAEVASWLGAGAQRGGLDSELRV